jgi:hydrogenase maturation protease
MIPPTARVGIVGLGNVLMGDDALGPTVVRVFESAYEVQEGVSVTDAGTPGLDLTPYLIDLDALILVDTVKSEGPPGALRLYRKEEILRNPPQPRLGPHDPGIKESLLTLDFSGRAPREVLLVGVIPGRVEHGVGLSEGVREAVPKACEAVAEELKRLGLPARPRSLPRCPDLWWESG